LINGRIANDIGDVTVHTVPLDNDHVYVTAVARRHAAPVAVCERLYAWIGEMFARENIEPVHERLFGALDGAAETLEARRKALTSSGSHGDTPVTYVQGQPVWGCGLAGLSMLAVRSKSPDEPETIRDGEGHACGRVWKSHGAEFIVLQGLHGLHGDARASRDPRDQAGRMFDVADRLLRARGTSYRSVRRTWLYLSDILSWYDGLNAVRSARYERFKINAAGVENGENLLLPASTGIEGDNPAGAAVTMDLLAIVPGGNDVVDIHQMTNPRQRDAFKYGSAFSRAAAIRMPEATWLNISGTAAIDEKGASCYPGDFASQMEMTLDVVADLISQEGGRLSDICNATLFLKNPDFAKPCAQILCEHGLESLPGIQVVADVCRDELLFEIDGTAVVYR
jgi:enamine deaminase RidA (YjgF/YER057c/UK114 family)